MEQRAPGSVVIDCGPSRAATLDETDTVAAKQPAGASLSTPPSIPYDQSIAVKDWRYSAVSVEGVDMASTARPGRPTRGQSSAGTDRPGHEPQLGASESVGNITKARFEPINRKNTEVGWGIVHLYRDGAETPGLGAAVETHDTGDTARLGVAGGKAGAGSEETEMEQVEDCTTLCVPAVPSFFTPSDFMGWVGPKTRDQVSHFRMVMTGRVNRYLVLMKFRDSGDAKKWREDWDGKLFFDLEVCFYYSLRTLILNILNGL